MLSQTFISKNKHEFPAHRLTHTHILRYTHWEVILRWVQTQWPSGQAVLALSAQETGRDAPTQGAGPWVHGTLGGPP